MVYTQPCPIFYPVDCYKGNSEALLLEGKRNLETAGARRKVVNRWTGLPQADTMAYHLDRADLFEND